MDRAMLSMQERNPKRGAAPAQVEGPDQVIFTPSTAGLIHPALPRYWSLNLFGDTGNQ